MKRSELINRIVYDALSYSGLEDGLCTLEEIAEDVLRVIEAAGMKPPPYQCSLLGDHMDDYMVHLWEPEDET